MVRSCSLVNCSNSAKQNYRFFVLPSFKKVAKRSAWLKKCRHLLPKYLPEQGNTISLCEGHFEPSQFIAYGPNIRTILKPTAVPTIFTRDPPKVYEAVRRMYNRIENNSDDSSFELVIDQPQQKKNSHSNDYSSSGLSDADSQSGEIELMQIRKDCMLLSTPQGKEMVSTDKSKECDDKLSKTSVNEFRKKTCDNSETIELESSIDNKYENTIESIDLVYQIEENDDDDNVDKQFESVEESSIPQSNKFNNLPTFSPNPLINNIEESTISDNDTVNLQAKIEMLKKQRDKARRKYYSLAERLESFENNLRKFLNEDQIKLLETESCGSNSINWTAATLEKSAKLRWIVGPKAYEYLRSIEHYPLPSFRTLYRYRNLSKINEFNDEAIQKYLELVVDKEIEDSDQSDDDMDIEKDRIIVPEHIKLEMLEPDESSCDQINSVKKPSDNR